MEHAQSIDFWMVHGVLFLIAMAIFPRLTLLLATAVTFTPLVLLGWFFCPYLLAAILATNYYWDTNPVLCVMVWLYALCGTGAEAQVCSSAENYVARGRVHGNIK